jgi:hypothetical protein
MIKKQNVKAALPAAARVIAADAVRHKMALNKAANSNHRSGVSQRLRDAFVWRSSLQAVTLPPKGITMSYNHVESVKSALTNTSNVR